VASINLQKSNAGHSYHAVLVSIAFTTCQKSIPHNSGLHYGPQQYVRRTSGKPQKLRAKSMDDELSYSVFGRDDRANRFNA
jgi:hypothetical protein